MKIKNILASLLLLTLPAVAQTNFSSASLPGTVGNYFRAYYSTNVNVAALLTLTKGAQTWDFSAGQQSYESIQRTDIVGPDDAGDAASFPAATYAERDTIEPSSQIAWRYYSLTNQGRYYYGLDNPLEVDASPVAIFNSPTLDIPATVQYGQTWSRAVNWSSLFFGFIPMSTDFTETSTVDAYGTLTLPAIGSVPALRVHETHTYQVYEIVSGSSPVQLDLHTNQYYYWLVPGLGVAAQVYLFGDNVLYPGSLDHTNAVLRVFNANYFTNQVVLGAVSGLRLRVQGTNALLNWQWMTNATKYRVDSAATLNNASWQTAGQPTTNSWTNAVSGSRQFYRVFGVQ